MEAVCDDIGLSMAAAFTIFAKKVAREHRIPFELNSDPFYSEENHQRLRASIAELEGGRGKEHDLETYAKGIL